jgi:hypothetical protein
MQKHSPCLLAALAIISLLSSCIGSKDAICVQEGRATAVVEISMDGSSQQPYLSQPDLTYAPTRQTYGGYELTYKVEP